MNKQLFCIIFATTLLASCSSSKRTHRPTDRPKIERNQKSKVVEKPAPGQLEVNRDNYVVADNFSNNKSLVKLINDWLGVPHRIGGKSKSGIDCSGFTSVVMSEVYHKNFTGPSSVMAIKSKRIDRDELREGDLVFFKINGNKVSHVGVYLSDGYFVHATLKRGVMISSLSEPYYARYYSEAGRVN
jgi:cell wall-associated NlpC family hydrolase